MVQETTALQVQRAFIMIFWHLAMVPTRRSYRRKYMMRRLSSAANGKGDDTFTISSSTGASLSESILDAGNGNNKIALTVFACGSDAIAGFGNDIFALRGASSLSDRLVNLDGGHNHINLHTATHTLDSRFEHNDATSKIK